MGRTATGATLATFVLTGAAIAAAAGCPGPMWALIAGSIVVLLGTFANHMPKLNTLPLVGAPRPVVTFKVNGSSNLIVRLARPDPNVLEEARSLLIASGVDDPEPSVRPQPRTAQIEVGVYNPSSFERIDKALINFLLPVGLRRSKTDASGNRRETGGEWLVTQDRVAGRVGAFDYWSQDDVDFATGSATLTFFEATFDEPGEYPIRMRISAPALYEKDYDTDAVVRVELGDDGPVEKITDTIDGGVELRGRLEKMSDDRCRVAVFDFLFEAREVVDAHYPKGVPLLSAASPHEGERSGVDYFESLVREDLAALYGIRRRLGETESTEAA